VKRLALALMLLGAGAAVPSEAAPRTMLTAVDEYLEPLRSSGVAPYEPESIRLVRPDAEGGEAISSARLRELLAPCGRGDMAAGYLSPANRKDFRIKQQWRCEGAVGYAGLVASFTTSQQGKRVAKVEIVLRDKAFPPPSPPPMMLPPRPSGKKR
jgi:hypothetical protein